MSEGVVWEWYPQDGVLRDYSTLPKDIVRAYLMPIPTPFFHFDRSKRPFYSDTLKMRLVCKKWRDLLDDYDAFWMMMQPEKTHATYFLSAMALNTEFYMYSLSNRKRMRASTVTSIKGKIARRQSRLLQLQDELSDLRESQAAAEVDVQRVDEDKQFVVAYRKKRKIKTVRKKKQDE